MRFSFKFRYPRILTAMPRTEARDSPLVMSASNLKQCPGFYLVTGPAILITASCWFLAFVESETGASNVYPMIHGIVWYPRGRPARIQLLLVADAPSLADHSETWGYFPRNVQRKRRTRIHIGHGFHCRLLCRAARAKRTQFLSSISVLLV